MFHNVIPLFLFVAMRSRWVLLISTHLLSLTKDLTKPSLTCQRVSAMGICMMFFVFFLRFYNFSIFCLGLLSKNKGKGGGGGGGKNKLVIIDDEPQAKSSGGCC